MSTDVFKKHQRRVQKMLDGMPEPIAQMVDPDRAQPASAAAVWDRLTGAQRRDLGLAAQGGRETFDAWELGSTACSVFKKLNMIEGFIVERPAPFTAGVKVQRVLRVTRYKLTPFGLEVAKFLPARAPTCVCGRSLGGSR